MTGLAVKGRAAMTGYDRDEFGPAWFDEDRNGCDTHNDILRRDLTQIVIKAGSNGCTVLSGVDADPYTGQIIDFHRGESSSNAVQIDHIVPLGDAWQTGAQSWNSAKREAFASDPLELLAVDGSANDSKGDGDTATWLPANKSYRCDYVARQIAVKAKYHLWITTPESAAMQHVLGSCPTPSPLPRVQSSFPLLPEAEPSTAPRTSPAATTAAAETTPPPTTDTETSPAPETGSPASSAAGDVYYQNCDAARAAGAAALHAGDPGYSHKLDRDGDGIACEGS